MGVVILIDSAMEPAVITILLTVGATPSLRLPVPFFVSNVPVMAFCVVKPEELLITPPSVPLVVITLPQVTSAVVFSVPPLERVILGELPEV